MALGHSLQRLPLAFKLGSNFGRCAVLLLQLGFQLRNFGVSLRKLFRQIAPFQQRGVARQLPFVVSGVDLTVYFFKRVGGLVGIGVRFFQLGGSLLSSVFALPRLSANFPRVFSAATMVFSNALICAAVSPAYINNHFLVQASLFFQLWHIERLGRQRTSNTMSAPAEDRI